MFWDNFWVNRSLTEAEICKGMMALFRVPQAQVLVLPDILERPGPVSASLVVVVPAPEQSDFPLRLDVYLFGGIADDWVGRPVETAPFHAQELIAFCHALSCVCLIPGETPNPSQWLRVEEYGVKTTWWNGNEMLT